MLGKAAGVAVVRLRERSGCCAESSPLLVEGRRLVMV